MEQYIDTTGTSARMVDLTKIGLTVQAALVQKTEGIDTRVPQTVFAITADNNTVQAVADQTGFAKTDEIVISHRGRENIEVKAKTESETERVTKKTNIDIRAILASVKDLEKQLEEIIKRAQGDEVALKQLLSFPDKAAARIGGLKLATIAPDLMVRNHATYKEAEWSEDVLKTAMPLQSPINAIMCFKIYQHINGAEKTLETAAQKNPAAAIERFHKYADHDSETPGPLAIRILQKAAKARPELAMQHFKEYGGGDDHCWPPDSFTRPKWAIDILREATRQNPELAIRYYGLYQSFMLIIDGKSRLEVDPERQKMLKAAVENDPRAGIEYYKNYSRDPNSEEILENATRRNPSMGIRKNQGLISESLIDEWINSNPQAVIEYLNSLSSRDLLRVRIIKKLLRKHPLASTDGIQDQGDVRVALYELSQENPLFYIRKFFT